MNLCLVNAAGSAFSSFQDVWGVPMLFDLNNKSVKSQYMTDGKKNTVEFRVQMKFGPMQGSLYNDEQRRMKELLDSARFSDGTLKPGLDCSGDDSLFPCHSLIIVTNYGTSHVNNDIIRIIRTSYY
jgi:hypothetical protein